MIDDTSLAERAKKIRLVLMDVDGVLTDGSLIYAPEGGDTKAFHVRDGAGIRLAQRAGIQSGIISGRESEVVTRRSEELGMTEVHQRVDDKLATYREIAGRLGLADEQVCYVGDDLVDVAVMKVVGLPAAPADAHPAVLPYAALVARCAGGHGAIRDILDRILQAQGLWAEVTAHYL